LVTGGVRVDAARRAASAPDIIDTLRFYSYRCVFTSPLPEAELRRRIEADGPDYLLQPEGEHRYVLRLFVPAANGTVAAAAHYRVLDRLLPELRAEYELPEVERRIMRVIADGETELELSGLGLTELPPSIGWAEQLEQLDISENRLASLPREIGLLRNLKVLIASNNELTRLPSSITYLTNLRKLELEHNYLTELPVDIGELSGLNRLWVAYNRLKRLPPQIALLENLKDSDFATRKQLPPRFPWALTVNGNPLESPPPEIRGSDAIRAYLAKSPVRSWSWRRIEGATTVVDHRLIVEWLVQRSHGQLFEIVAGPDHEMSEIEIGEDRVSVVYDRLGMVRVGTRREAAEAVRALVESVSLQTPDAKGLAARTTSELVELEATGRYTLGGEWADSLFYASAFAPPGGSGCPVIHVRGSAPLQWEIFHKPPPPGEPIQGAHGLICRPAAVSMEPLQIAVPGGPLTPLPTLALIGARARIAKGLLGGERVELQPPVDVRPLWVKV